MTEPEKKPRRVVLTWRLFVWAYAVPMALVVAALILSVTALSDEIAAKDELRRAHEAEARRHLAAERRGDVRTCRVVKTNAQVNIAQNERLGALLKIVRDSARRPDHPFYVAVAESLVQMEKENDHLRPSAITNCQKNPNADPILR